MSHSTGEPVLPRLLRPSHVILRSRWIVSVTIAAAVALTAMAAFGHPLLLEVDLPVAEALRDPRLNVFLEAVTEAGSPTSAGVVGFVVAAALWRRCKAFALAFPAAVLAGVATDLTTKVLVDRPRPPAPLIETSLGSYPSGHVLQATIVFGLVVPALYLLTRSPLVQRLTLLLFVVVVVGVAWSRVALNAHWPTDTLGSFVLGSGILLTAELLVDSRRGHQLCGGCPLHSPVPPERYPRPPS